MNRIGTQCQLDSGDFMEYNLIVQPVAMMVINVAKREFLQQLWEGSNALQYLIYRHHPNLDWADDPEQRGRENAEAITAHIAPVADLFTHIVDNNEFIYDENHSPPERIDAADRYIAAFIEEAAKHGFGVCWGNFNVGHFGPQFVDQFERALDASSATAFPCFHSYSWPTLDTSPQYLVNRYKTIMGPVRERYLGMKCAITELGVDSGVVGEGHKGWRLTKEDLTEAAALYCDGLNWINSDLEDYVLFALIFGCGMYGDWASMDIADSPVIECVAALPQQEPPPEEEPPTMTDTLESIRVFEWDVGNESHIELTSLVDKERVVKQKYGAAFRRAEVSAGAKVFRLVELWEKTGSSALITNVMNENGQPIDQQDVAFYWPGAPDPPDPPTTLYSHDHHPNFVHGPTNVNGDVGPGMGHGAYHGIGEGGPHAVWVRDPDVPSDICEKLGMLAGTFHDHLDQKFRLMTQGSEEPGNGNGGGEGKFVKQYEQWEAGPHNYFRLVSLNHDLYDMGGNLQVLDADGNVIWEIDDLVPPGVFDGLPGIQFDTTYTEPVDRIYAASIVYLPTKEVVGGPWPCTFHAGETGTWLLTVKWSEDGGNGGEEEPPPSGSKAEAYNLIARGHELIAQGYHILKGL